MFDVAERAEANAAFADIRLPSDKDLTALGDFPQGRRFSDAFDIIHGQGHPEVACFLIHGPVDYGQQQTLARLRFKYEKDFDSEPHRLTASVGALWQGRSLEKLLANIGDRIAKGYVPESVDALAVRLKDLLQTKDVLLEITDLHRFKGALPEFVNQFWNPLAARLSIETLTKRLVAFITIDQPVASDLDAFLFDPVTGNPADFNIAKIIKLPKLDAFTQAEIARWATNWLKKDPARGNDQKQLDEDAESIAATLFQETSGKPMSLYSKLKAQTTWC
jgi:hypothetical protein